TRPVQRITIQGRIAEETPENREIKTEDPPEIEATAGKGAPSPAGESLSTAIAAEEGPKEQAQAPPAAGREEKKALEEAILFFYSPHCRECLAVKEQFLPSFRRRHPGVAVFSYNLATPDGYRALLAVERSLGRPLVAAPPLVIIGRKVLEGKEEIEKYMQEPPGQGRAKTAIPRPARVDTAAGLRRLRLSAVVLGGLLDGINPCAFATLIFLLSYLLFVGKARRLVPVGLGFAAGVFAGYFAIGLGLLELLGRLQAFPVLHRVFRLGLAAALFFLGLAGLRDARLIQKGRTREAVLQLPDGLKRRIHTVIREEMKGRVAIGGSMIMGILVAFFEFPCTGQVYFPVVALLREGGEAWSTALGYLLLYNLLFIAPLFVLIFLLRLGTNSTHLAEMARRQAASVRLLLALFSFLLAGLLLASGIR
ncbi:MAG: hypothetical protein GX493_06070, partial [Firmicutes bacterium]|nr:hypothetical protein [Bacillota bacterium]